MTEFPLTDLGLFNNVTPHANSTLSYNSRGVTNHYGIEDAGHYTSLCRSWFGDTGTNVMIKTLPRMSGNLKPSTYYLMNPFPPYRQYEMDMILLNVVPMGFFSYSTRLLMLSSHSCGELGGMQMMDCCPFIPVPYSWYPFNPTFPFRPSQWRNNRVGLVAKCHGPTGPKGLLGPRMGLVHILWVSKYNILRGEEAQGGPSVIISHGPFLSWLRHWPLNIVPISLSAHASHIPLVTPITSVSCNDDLRESFCIQ